MPVARFYLVASAYAAETLTSLLVQASHFYATALYPELDPPPVERVRAFIVDAAPDHWATGGIPVSQGGQPAPFFTCLSLKGRPASQLQGLMAGLTDLVVRHLGCERGIVRGQLIQIDPGDWFIAGNPASQARGAEIARRMGD